MTKQIVDQIIYEGERHRPLSISGKGLPHPRDFGLRPGMMSTACWRGFYCEYTVRQDQLWLTHLVVHHDGEYPPIAGVNALYEDERLLGENEDEPEPLPGRWLETVWVMQGETEVSGWGIIYDGGIYANLNVPAPLTGGILLAIDDLDIPPYIQYDLSHLISSKTILELLFEKGTLVKKIDHSAAVAAKREQVLALQVPDYETPEYDLFEAEIKAWIRSTLTRDYQLFDASWLREVYP